MYPLTRQTSEEDYPEGVEVYNQYGFRPNRELLEYYGFVDANNPNDAIELLITPEQLAQFSDVEAKAAYLQDHYVDPNYFTVSVRASILMRSYTDMVKLVLDCWRP